MQITSVRVNLDLNREPTRFSRSASRLVAFASLVFDGSFVVSNIRVVRADSGRMLVLMPSRENNAGQFREMAYPINSELRRQIDSTVMQAVETKAKERGYDLAANA